MKNVHFRTWNMARKLKKVKNEKGTLEEMEYGEKHLKTWKMRNAHYRTCNMARKPKNVEKETHTHTHTVGPGIWQEK